MLGCQLDYTQNELKSKGLGPAVRKLSFKSFQVGRSPLTWAHLVQAAVPGTRKEARSLPACSQLSGKSTPSLPSLPSLPLQPTSSGVQHTLKPAETASSNSYWILRPSTGRQALLD